ncbi:hypothetical protein [Corynebacterium halotolerans]|uniref:Uncharacterized protein n=1 Tax=Corynebacterium halotolerans YIM 70093 = DSM 44683 TaxID=1121362 RepID=M1P4K6_9CORY|nr:hypothetical protein [Corynebacterium halotolerans]AGF71571.1 hypothetical protein A605_02785 [Corynebacterium halotolerans YIM 70093 = DSM 44683]
MTSTTPSLTPFQDRHAAVATSLAAVSVIPPHGPAMVEADQAVADKLQELSSALAAPAVESVADTARRWARGEVKLDTLTKKITAPAVRERHTVSVPDDSRAGWTTHAVARPEAQRYAAARKAAHAALVADLDRPEWATTALVEACRESVTYAMENMAAAAQETLETLPAAGREWLLTDINARPENIARRLIDGQSTPSAHIDAYRATAAAWAALMDVRNSTAWSALFKTMAAGRPTDPHRPGGPEFPEDQFGNIMADPAAIWMDWETNVAMAMGGTGGMAGVILQGRGKFAPLADPLGADADEYMRRWSVREAVTAWAISKNEDLSARLGRSLQNGRVPERLPHVEGPLYRAAGYSSPDQALAVYLDRERV